MILESVVSTSSCLLQLSRINVKNDSAFDGKISLEYVAVENSTTDTW